MSAFRAIEDFVLRHRPCGAMAGNVTRPMDIGYGYEVHVLCCCGAFFERWITDADRDLLHSGLLPFTK
jgi:hypothetical protein